MAASTKERLGNTQALTEDLSPAETDRRVAILKRFRELLQSQRDRFRTYLDTLDKQKDVIEQGSADALMAHVELEEKIVTDIFAIQKVIDPLEAMYRTAYPEKYKAAAGPEPVSEVKNLKSALEDLSAEAVSRTERNRALLAGRMEEIRKEINVLRKNPYARQGRSVYGANDSPSFIDIQS
jgi:archaellum component FlaC